MDLGQTIKSFFGGKKDEPRDTPAAAAPKDEGFLSEVVDAVVGGEGDLRETVEGALSGFEQLVKKIPGYKGYKEKEMRREADKLLRDEVARLLDDQRKRLSELQNQLISQAQIEYLDDVERVVMKLQLLIDRVKTASYGYAGLFDAVKVKEEQLDALYEFDNQMMGYADDFAAGVDKASSSISAREGVGEALTGLVGIVDEANQTFGHREEVILRASDF